MMCNKDILQLSFEDLNQFVSPENQLPIYKLSKSAPLTHIQYVQAVCYQDIFCWDILTLESGNDCLSHNVGMELPLYAAYNPRR